jgi:hypothetical protein
MRNAERKKEGSVLNAEFGMRNAERKQTTNGRRLKKYYHGKTRKLTDR